MTGFPADAWAWLQRLGHTAEEPTQAWREAWAMATRTCEYWSPRRHLLRYLASCEHRGLAPSSVTWIRFLVEDEQKEAREIEVQVHLRLRESENEEARRQQVPESLRKWRDEWID